MRRWSLLLVEGAHDALVIRAALLAMGWQQSRDEMPETLAKLKPDRRHGPNLPLAEFTTATAGIALRSVEGVENVIGKVGAKLALDVRHGLHAFGVIVDADLQQADRRVSAFRSTYRQVFPDSDRIVPGVPIGSSPRVGLWVFPNNHDSGSLEDVFISQVAETRRELLDAATVLVNSAAFRSYGTFDGSNKGKAILGAIGQADKPAASLPSALQDRHERWFPDGWQPTGPLLEVVRFIEALSGP